MVHRYLPVCIIVPVRENTTRKQECSGKVGKNLIRLKMLKRPLADIVASLDGLDSPESPESPDSPESPGGPDSPGETKSPAT